MQHLNQKTRNGEVPTLKPLYCPGETAGNSAHTSLIAILTYFWMLLSIKGYFTRRLLGESAIKDKQLVNNHLLSPRLTAKYHNWLSLDLILKDRNSFYKRLKLRARNLKQRKGGDHKITISFLWSVSLALLLINAVLKTMMKKLV